MVLVAVVNNNSNNKFQIQQVLHSTSVCLFVYLKHFYLQTTCCVFFLGTIKTKTNRWNDDKSLKKKNAFKQWSMMFVCVWFGWKKWKKKISIKKKTWTFQKIFSKFPKFQRIEIGHDFSKKSQIAKLAFSVDSHWLFRNC